MISIYFRLFNMSADHMFIQYILFLSFIFLSITWLTNLISRILLLFYVSMTVFLSTFLMFWVKCIIFLSRSSGWLRVSIKLLAYLGLKRPVGMRVKNLHTAWASILTEVLQYHLSKRLRFQQHYWNGTYGNIAMKIPYIFHQTFENCLYK